MKYSVLAPNCISVDYLHVALISMETEIDCVALIFMETEIDCISMTILRVVKIFKALLNFLPKSNNLQNV